MAVARIVVDTNVFIAALLRREGFNRKILRSCLEEKVQPLMGQALFMEYEDVFGRNGLFRDSPLSGSERQQMFDAFLSACEWVKVYYRWRPNLRDEGDNHLVELAVAGSASAILTHNVSDFQKSDLLFPQIRVITPKEFTKEIT